MPPTAKKATAPAAPPVESIAPAAPPLAEPLPAIEAAGADADNSMINGAGDRFYPDDPSDAVTFALYHGARPEHPERWPWSEQLQLGPFIAPAFDPTDEIGEALPEGRCDEPAGHERHDFLQGGFGSTDYRCCEGEALSELFAPTHCPTPEICFPAPFGPHSMYAGCVHGETIRDGTQC